MDEAKYHDFKVRQMCVFNMSVCFAKCGYATKAIEAVELVTLTSLKSAAHFNLIIYLVM